MASERAALGPSHAPLLRAQLAIHPRVWVFFAQSAAVAGWREPELRDFLRREGLVRVLEERVTKVAVERWERPSPSR